MAANDSKLKIVGAVAGKYFCTTDNGFAKMDVAINLVITKGRNEFIFSWIKFNFLINLPRSAETALHRKLNSLLR